MKEYGNKNLTNKTIKGFIWLSTGSGLQAILKIVVLAILARVVTPEEFGLVGAALIVVGFSKLVTQMGVGPAIVQRKDLTRTHIETGFTLSVLIGLLCTVIVYASSSLIGSFFRMTELPLVLKYISFTFLIEGFCMIPLSLLQRDMKFKLISIVSIISYLIGYGGVSIVLGYMGYGVWALVSGIIAQTLIQALILLFVQYFPKTITFNKEAFTELMYFAGGITLARIANYIALQGDNMVVGRWLGAAALGVYGRAYTFMVMPVSLFGTALDKALFPAMAKVQDDKPKLRTVFYKGVGVISLVALPIGILITLLSEEIVVVFLGSDWREVIIPLQVLSIGLLFRMSYKMSDSLTRAVGAVYNRAWRQVIYAALIIVGCFVGQFWGLGGVSVAVVVALLGNYLFMAHLSIKLIDGSWRSFFLCQKHGLFISVISGSVLIVFVNALRSVDLPNIIILLSSTLVFGLILCILYLLWSEKLYGKTGTWMVNYFTSIFKK